MCIRDSAYQVTGTPVDLLATQGDFDLDCSDGNDVAIGGGVSVAAGFDAAGGRTAYSHPLDVNTWRTHLAVPVAGSHSVTPYVTCFSVT